MYDTPVAQTREERERIGEQATSEDRFEEAFEHAPIGTALVAPDGRLLRVNRALCEILGYPEEELLGKTFQDVTYPEDLGASLRHARRKLSGEVRAYQTETRYFRKEGRVVWALLSVSAVWDEGGEILYFIYQIQDITERRVLQEKLAHLAYHDPLTGLPNRLLLEERLERAFARSSRSGTLVGLLYLDLDGFKRVNDSLGHDVGDRLLVAWARRLMSHFRAVDTVARVGGDEFCILLEGITSAEEAGWVARRTRRLLDEPLTVKGRLISLTVSIGVAVRLPDQDLAAERLLREADIDMYRNKKSPRRPGEPGTPHAS